MDPNAWEVEELEPGQMYRVEARSDNNRYNVALYVEDEEEARELADKLNSVVSEVFACVA